MPKNTSRLVNAVIISTLYFLFLAWYDGWGMTTLTPAEVDQYIANIREDSELNDLRDTLRTMGVEDNGREFYMLNLNRYQYAPGEPAEGIPADYQAYSNAVIWMVLGNAGHPIYAGRFPTYPLTTQNATDWHSVILVRYRSRRDFISMVTSDAYQDIVVDRAGGIAYAEVTPTTPEISLSTPRLVVFFLLVSIGFFLDLVLRQRESHFT